MTAPNLRDRYLQETINTASPAKLLIMLYDRLILDLGLGAEAFRNGDHELGSAKVMHAQEIVMELQITLDVNAWDGAPGLASLYGFILTELIGANIRRDADRVDGCRKLLEPLRDAWREAASLT
ncbi:flagellar export chaperone FliS [Actinoplanes sp. NPDC023714]|uniref:flagellar export chaperone FliS n=1 Tax=Actinoplanes sp. NPDC023714 TaxID=3154322 RepID=UPI0033FD3C82